MWRRAVLAAVLVALATFASAEPSGPERLARVDTCYDAVSRWGREAGAGMRLHTSERRYLEAIEEAGKIIKGLTYVFHYYMSTLRFLAENANRGSDAIDFVIERCGDYMVPHLTRCPNPLRCNLKLDKGGDG